MTRTMVNNNYDKLFIMSKGIAPGTDPDTSNFDDAYFDTPVNPLIVCNGGKLFGTNIKVTQTYAIGTSLTLNVDGNSAKEFFWPGDRVWSYGTPMSLVGIVNSVTDTVITLKAKNGTAMSNNDDLYGERNYVGCYEIRKNKQDPPNSASHKVTLMANIAATNSTSIVVSNIDSLNDDNGVIKIGNEIIRYTATNSSTNTLTTQAQYRGWLSTTAATHNAGAEVYQLGNPYGNNALNMKGVSNSDDYQMLNRVYPNDNDAKIHLENLGNTKGYKIKTYSGITPYDSGLNTSSAYLINEGKEIGVNGNPTLLFDIGDSIFTDSNILIGEIISLGTNKIFLKSNNQVALSSGDDIYVGGKGILLPTTLINDYDHFVMLYADNPLKHHLAKITAITTDDIAGDSFEFSPAYGPELSKEVKYSIYKGPKVEKELTISSITFANPAVFTTSVAHNYSVGDEVNITDCNVTPYNNQNIINGTHLITEVTSTTQFKISNALNANLRAGSTGDKGKVTLISPVVAVGYGLYGKRTSVNASNGVDVVQNVFFNEYGADSDTSDGSGNAIECRHIGMTYVNSPLFYFYNDRLDNKNQLDFNSKYKLHYSRSNGLQETHYQRCFLTQKGQGTIITDYSKYGMEATVHDV